jgi:DNA-binding NarL/FixJ family response regulator
MEEEPVRKYTILLVEHVWPIIFSVKEALKGDRELDYLGSVETMADLVKFVQEAPPDLVLVDLNMPQTGEDHNGLIRHEPRFEVGLTMITRIKELSPNTKVIPFSDYVPKDAQLAKKALKAGADAFLPKQEGPGSGSDWSEWLRFKIRTIAKGYWQMDASLAQAIEEEETSQPKKIDEIDSLSERQLEVIKLLANGKTDDQIGATLNIEPATVRTHISNIQHKLQARGRKEAVERYKKRDQAAATD